jgi:hypothetical protein
MQILCKLRRRSIEKENPENEASCCGGGDDDDGLVEVCCVVWLVPLEVGASVGTWGVV